MAFLHAAASHVKTGGLKKGRLPYLLLAPGLIFLFTFFILPIANLATTSTQTPVQGGDTGSYEQTWHFSNYITAFTENKEQFGRSFLYAFLTTVQRQQLPIHLLMRSHSNRENIRTSCWSWSSRHSSPRLSCEPSLGSRFLAKKDRQFRLYARYTSSRQLRL